MFNVKSFNFQAHILFLFYFCKLDSKHVINQNDSKNKVKFSVSLLLFFSFTQLYISNKSSALWLYSR